MIVINLIFLFIFTLSVLIERLHNSLKKIYNLNHQAVDVCCFYSNLQLKNVRFLFTIRNFTYDNLMKFLFSNKINITFMRSIKNYKLI